MMSVQVISGFRALQRVCLSTAWISRVPGREQPGRVVPSGVMPEGSRSAHRLLGPATARHMHDPGSAVGIDRAWRAFWGRVCNGWADTSARGLIVLIRDVRRIGAVQVDDL